MFGNSLTIGGNAPASAGDIVYQDIVCHNQMIDKYPDDKIFAHTDQYIVLLDGVIENKVALTATLGTWGGEALWQLYQTHGERFFAQLRGSFAGALFDKQRQRWIIFGDPLGSKFLFYAHSGHFFCLAPSMGDIYRLLQANGRAYHLDEQAAYMILTYGYCLDGLTLCSEVRKVNPGCYLTLEADHLEEHRYYLLSNTPDTHLDMHSAIDLVDEKFRQAVKRQFDKDREYSYRHLVALSGGLDSRMTSIVAHELGYTDQLNITFSQSDYFDQSIPMHIASDYGHQWLFKSLDDGQWLREADVISQTLGGCGLYDGSAHGHSLYRYLNFDGLSMVHSGQIGDVVVGSFIDASSVGKPYSLGEKAATSLRYLDKLGAYKPALELDKEIGMFYYRAFYGTNNGLQQLYHHTESLSPFLELDMLEASLSIPVALRQHHHLYFEWIKSRYPKAANYPWEKIGRRITARRLHLLGREVFAAEVPGLLLAKVGIRTGRAAHPRANMNPVDYYVDHTPDLRNYLLAYFDYLPAIDHPDLRNTLLEIKQKGSTRELLAAVTLLSAVKCFYQ